MAATCNLLHLKNAVFDSDFSLGSLCVLKNTFMKYSFDRAIYGDFLRLSYNFVDFFCLISTFHIGY